MILWRGGSEEGVSSNDDEVSSNGLDLMMISRSRATQRERAKDDNGSSKRLQDSEGDNGEIFDLDGVVGEP